jgi:hypothetical protein
MMSSHAGTALRRREDAARAVGFDAAGAPEAGIGASVPAGASATSVARSGTGPPADSVRVEGADAAVTSVDPVEEPSALSGADS